VSENERFISGKLPGRAVLLYDTRETNRIEDIFPYPAPEVEKNLRVGNIDKSKGLVIGWVKEKHRERIDDRWGICWDKFIRLVFPFTGCKKPSLENICGTT